MLSSLSRPRDCSLSLPTHNDRHIQFHPLFSWQKKTPAPHNSMCQCNDSNATAVCVCCVRKCHTVGVLSAVAVRTTHSVSLGQLLTYEWGALVRQSVVAFSFKAWCDAVFNCKEIPAWWTRISLGLGFVENCGPISPENLCSFGVSLNLYWF